MPTATQNSVSCPKCEGDMWDNRVSKKNPKAPDFKCKDKGCDGVRWPEKGGNGRQAAPKPEHHNDDGPLPWEKEQQADERRFVDDAKSNPAPAVQSIDKLNALLNGYSLCFAHATNLAWKVKTDKALDADVSAMAATLFIQACQKGLI